MKWKVLVIFQMEFIAMTLQSIAGLTYIDDYDFEEKYRNLYECDPFYWHPLHLPEKCSAMFEKLIRSRVATAIRRPVRIVSRREKMYEAEENVEPPPQEYYKYLEPQYDFPYYDYGASIIKTEYLYNYDDEDEQEIMTRPLSPYEEMLELLGRDVNKNPSAPVVGMSNYGPVAMYEQPISKKSQNLILKIARAYADAGKKRKDKGDPYYYGKIEFPSSMNISMNSENIRSKTDSKNKTVQVNAKKKLRKTKNSDVTKKRIKTPKKVGLQIP